MADFDWANNVCFVCGSDVAGLHLKFLGDGTEVHAETVIEPPYQGFQGVVHGGILAGIMDDAMWHVIHQEANAFPVTAELKVRYLAPVAIGETIRIRARVLSYGRRLMVAKATISQPDGTLMASAEGRFMPPLSTTTPDD